MADILKTATRIVLISMGVIMLIWAVVPNARTIALGLALGSIGSIVNATILQRRIERMAEVVSGESAPRRVGLGLGSRIAMVLLVVMIAYRFPEQINLPAALAACFLVQVMSPFAAVWHNIREDKRKG